MSVALLCATLPAARDARWVHALELPGDAAARAEEARQRETKEDAASRDKSEALAELVERDGELVYGRAEEALKLMKHFDDFLDGDTSVSPVFTDKARLYEAADIIQKLQLIAQVRNKCDPIDLQIDLFATGASRVRV